VSVQVFVITVDGVDEYWTGEQADSGALSRSEFRADARKFASREEALVVADTHAELRDSDQWRLMPLSPGCGRLG
jgi:hypothetical protein